MDAKKYKDIVYKIIGAAMEVHSEMNWVFNYLRLTKKPIGLLINFGQESLQGERYAYDEDTNECILLDKNMEPFFK